MRTRQTSFLFPGNVRVNMTAGAATPKLEFSSKLHSPPSRRQQRHTSDGWKIHFPSQQTWLRLASRLARVYCKHLSCFPSRRTTTSHRRNMKDMVHIATAVGNVYRGPGRLLIPAFIPSWHAKNPPSGSACRSLTGFRGDEWARGATLRETPPVKVQRAGCLY